MKNVTRKLKRVFNRLEKGVIENFEIELISDDEYSSMSIYFDSSIESWILEENENNSLYISETDLQSAFERMLTACKYWNYEF